LRNGTKATHQEPVDRPRRLPGQVEPDHEPRLVGARGPRHSASGWGIHLIRKDRPGGRSCIDRRSDHLGRFARRAHEGRLVLRVHAHKLAAFAVLAEEPLVAAEHAHLVVAGLARLAWLTGLLRLGHLPHLIEARLGPDLGKPRGVVVPRRRDGRRAGTAAGNQ
jgi:hypothetical protein